MPKTLVGGNDFWSLERWTRLRSGLPRRLGGPALSTYMTKETSTNKSTTHEENVAALTERAFNSPHRRYPE